MTLDEYRNQVVTEIKKCGSESRAHELIRQAAAVLSESNISVADSAQFWTQLSSDLNAEKLKPQLLVEKQDAASLSAVIASAQAIIAQHQAQTSAKK